MIYAAGAAFVYTGSRKNIPSALRPLALAYMLMLCVLSVSLPPAAADGVLVGQARGVFRRDVLPRFRRRAVRYALRQEGRAAKQNFVVMLTYILAQTLLAIGFAACP